MSPRNRFADQALRPREVQPAQNLFFPVLLSNLSLCHCPVCQHSYNSRTTSALGLSCRQRLEAHDDELQRQSKILVRVEVMQHYKRIQAIVKLIAQ